MDQTTKLNKIKIIGILIVVIGIGLIAFIFKPKASEQTNKTTDTATTTTVGGVQVGVVGNGNYKVEQVAVNTTKQTQTSKPVPDLNRTTVFTATMSAENKTLLANKITNLQNDLKKDSTNITNWIELGLDQKSAGDYAGASLSWQYATTLNPDAFVAFGNLGDLYAYHLKDNALAETSYLKAISNAPTQEYLYAQLALVYRDVFKNIDKARAMVNQGLSKIPNSQYLLQLKNSLQ